MIQGVDFWKNPHDICNGVQKRKKCIRARGLTLELIFKKQPLCLKYMGIGNCAARLWKIVSNLYTKISAVCLQNKHQSQTLVQLTKQARVQKLDECRIFSTYYRLLHICTNLGTLSKELQLLAIAKHTRSILLVFTFKKRFISPSILCIPLWH